MRPEALQALCCPLCHSQLLLRPFANTQAHVLAGVLQCLSSDCRAWYPVAQGVPRMIPVPLRSALTHQFIATFHKRLREIGIDPTVCISDSVGHDDSQQLTHRTLQHFSYEWRKYDRFGWEDSIYDIEWSRRGFLHRSLLEPSQIGGTLVLDAGCGNGRYTFCAAEHGAIVFGVDISGGVDTAFKNTVKLSNVHIIQGDIFQLPFAPDTFDIVFSVGVLMHTGDAKGAAQRLSTLVKPGGSITVHVYQKGNPVYEFLDRMIRKRTTRMSAEQLARFSKQLYTGTRILQRLRVLRLLNKRVVRLDAHPHCVFDWYGAPAASHHSYGEVKGWFREMGFSVARTNEPKINGSLRRLTNRVAGRLLRAMVGTIGAGSVTVRAVRPMAVAYNAGIKQRRWSKERVLSLYHQILT